ncbi:spermidine spermine n -acetyltransferase-like protein 1-like protein [Lasius niger]|uniref:Spermidine spermine n-acetyltransferase-like protein 1-like protein n=1 Tax=Lasius niger TaxID=67767 RepID=A0A0J7MW48_LASNI|nr:spermidine spermine n -acetyltransferase-like protein 1-like protein [Lasius niger]
MPAAAFTFHHQAAVGQQVDDLAGGLLGRRDVDGASSVDNAHGDPLVKWSIRSNAALALCAPDFGGVQLFVALENAAAVAPARLLLVGAVHAGAHEARTPEIGGADVGITKIGVGQVAVAEITARRAAVLEHALIQTRLVEVGGVQRRFAENRLIELPAAALRLSQVGLQPQRLLRLHARQVGAPQRSALEVALAQRRLAEVDVVQLVIGKLAGDQALPGVTFAAMVAFEKRDAVEICPCKFCVTEG